MNILAIADRPPRTSILSILAAHPIELICTLGDLDYFALSELEGITHIPKIGVYGNHCSGMYFNALGIQNMHLTTFEYGGLVFGGFEGSVRYKQNPDARMSTQEEATILLKGFPRVDVLLTHAPPFGVNDEPESISHQGFHALRDYVEQKKPAYLLHGHTYPASDQLETKLADTEILYVYQDRLITLQTTHIEIDQRD